MPAYTLPPNAESVAVLRMVVKENFSRDMADMLAADIKRALAKLDGVPSPQAEAAGGCSAASAEAGASLLRSRWSAQILIRY